MSTGTILLLSMIGTGLVLVAPLIVIQLRARQPVSVGLAAAVVGFCALFGIGAAALDGSVAETTRTEVAVAGSDAGPAVRSIPFDVEHPGAEHTVLVDQQAEEPATSTADVRVQITDPTGRVVADETHRSEWECASRGGCGWAEFYVYLEPAVTGPHTVTVTMLSPGVETLHVAVFDEDETDGERMPGY